MIKKIFWEITNYCHGLLKILFLGGHATTEKNAVEMD